MSAPTSRHSGQGGAKPQPRPRDDWPRVPAAKAGGLRGVQPIAERLGSWFVTRSAHDIELRRPDIVLVNNADAIPALRAACDRSASWLVGLRHGVANKYIGPDPEYGLVDYFCGSEWD